MNKILIALTSLLLAAVIFLFIKVFSMEKTGAVSEEVAETEQAADSTTTTDAQQEQASSKKEATQPTGRIAYINIDELNEQSLEISDLVAESKRRQSSIEASVESLRERYQQKIEDFQRSQRTGIAPESVLRDKAKEIEDIEREAANKQAMMEDLTMDISRKNSDFQQRVRDFLMRWNQGRYDYILSYSEAVPSLLIGNPALEVTDEVIAGLNEEYRNRKGKKVKK